MTTSNQFDNNDSNLADVCATTVINAFETFNGTFQQISRRAKRRFEQKDWNDAGADASERLDAYNNSISRALDELNSKLDSHAQEQSVWIAAREQYARFIAQRYDIDRAETFFNSVSRRMLGTVGINKDVEFFYLSPKAMPVRDPDAIYRTYAKVFDTKSLVKKILNDLAFSVAYQDIERDAELIAQEIDLNMWPLVGNDRTYSIDVVKEVFYRNKEAYVVGRFRVAAQTVPLIIPLANDDDGIFADTVLLRQSDASVIFSFAYSYFLVDVERYDALVEFLRSVLPHAKQSELYTAVGHNRHGKTEFYRDLHQFVHTSKEQFVIAPGIEGAVMIGFTFPSFDFVFKVIKDKPCFLRSNAETPKIIRKDQVRTQYSFVAHRDRAGRMVDTQEFDNLLFKKRRFSDDLLEEFRLAAQNSVTIDDEFVVLQHLYVQRKVLPLPLYFQTEKNPEAIRRVLIDFGYFLKDITASGVFPSDLFNIWNYGVTNWGRVVLFDYDDVMPIERIKFREKPAPRNEMEETEPEENWIVATEDVFFMDEIDRYSGIPYPLRGVFKSVHGDLYTLKFWDTLMDKLNRGEMFDVIPYERSKRFARR